MTTQQRRNRTKTSSSLTIKNRSNDDEEPIPVPSRQGELNDQTDFAYDPALIFDELPQPFRRINKVLDSIFDTAWDLIEQREQQRLVDATKFVSAQHNSSTIIQTSSPVFLIGSHINGNLCFFHGVENDQPNLICYDSQVDEIINYVNVETPIMKLNVFRMDSALKDVTYYFSIIDQSGYWKMYAYKNQQYYHLFTQYETEDDSKRPMCVTTQTGINDEYLAVVWFNPNDSWLELYKLPKDQWKSEIAAQEQAALSTENVTEESVSERPVENGPTLIRGQFSRPTMFFKIKAPKLSPGSNNIQQLMKNTENSTNVGQGIVNHLYTSQAIDAKYLLIKELIAPSHKIEGADRPIDVPKPDPATPIVPILHFIPANSNVPSSAPSLVVSWPSTNQLLIYKIVKAESKGKDTADTRPVWIWPFAHPISSLSYDVKYDHLAVGLQTGNVCIIERSSGMNEMPSVQDVSSLPIRQIYSLESQKISANTEKNDKRNGFLALSDDGFIYQLKFHSMLSSDNAENNNKRTPCFPHQLSKDTSKIVRIVWLDFHSTQLFLTINEKHRIYVNDALNHKQLCEIVLPQSNGEEISGIHVGLIDQTRSIIIGISDTKTRAFDQTETEHLKRPSLRLYRVPLEHFPSVANFYPQRVPTATDESESIIETKTSKVGSQAKKQNLVVEVDKSLLAFDEKIRELFRKRQSEAYERRERLITRWNEIKRHHNPVHDQV